MADQPKRTVTPRTGPDAGKARSQDSSDTSTTPDHEKGLIDSIKGLIENHAKGKAPGGEVDGKQQSVDSAVDQMSQAVKAAPGGTTYG